MTENIIAPIDTDDAVQEEINSSLLLENPTSFFLYAGAGSGKTRSLVNAVTQVIKNYSRSLSLRGQSIAVITYTNAAAEEVSKRLEFNRLVHVSTIHSFAWRLIKDFQVDIREHLRQKISTNIAEMEAKSSRPGTKAENTRLYKLERERSRLEELDTIRFFTYSPSGDNRDRSSITHSEVIALTAEMLQAHPRLVDLLAGRYPFLFVDESQDTNATLLDALLKVQETKTSTFCLGLFGDTMQRIYNDGKVDLEGALEGNWSKPEKRMNHRSARRIVELANSIRADADPHVQLARADQLEGTVRLFLADPSMPVDAVETYASNRMSSITNDSRWQGSFNDPNGGKNGVMKLILEHHLAAARLGFSNLFTSLSKLESDRTAILEGRHPEVMVFSQELVPLIQAVQAGDEYAIMSTLRVHSPLLSMETLDQNSSDGYTTVQQLDQVNDAIDSLTTLWKEKNDPTVFDIAKVTLETGLFQLPDSVRRAVEYLIEHGEAVEDESQAWVDILQCSFEELQNYTLYTAGQTEFATHQGVKGLEFPRVMLILNDKEAKGFLFSYEKLFGAKAPTEADRRNEMQGKESSLDRTRRLFYVTCTRAEESLAVVAYTADPNRVREHISKKNWFRPSEIEVISSSVLN